MLTHCTVGNLSEMRLAEIIVVLHNSAAKELLVLVLLSFLYSPSIQYWLKQQFKNIHLLRMNNTNNDNTRDE